MWHSFGDYFTMLFDTLSPLFGYESNGSSGSGGVTSVLSSEGSPSSTTPPPPLPAPAVPLTWVTRTPPAVAANHACSSAADCAPYLYTPTATSNSGGKPRLPILRHFIDFFKNRVVFIDNLLSSIPATTDPNAVSGAVLAGNMQFRYVEGKLSTSGLRVDPSKVVPPTRSPSGMVTTAMAVHFSDVFLGMRNACSPIPDSTIRVDECEVMLHNLRTHVLTMYGMSPSLMAPGLSLLPEAASGSTSGGLPIVNLSLIHI
eukprot:TRINITY_DN12193_c0_g1_i2.p1 TRINITY_DN12193_c0_g1~~TRINITY_DN12193_c0_g1_i2.p1  ORF type:complete len:258 (+),score=23.03 TRINITY_DN12193_c0_g1_i2:558-1331(+)